MKNLNTILSVATLAAMAATVSVTSASAEGAKEKCYGIAKAGKNDCGNAGSHITCAGSAKVDHDGAAFIVVPKGLCERIPHGSLTPVAASSEQHKEHDKNHKG